MEPLFADPSPQPAGLVLRRDLLGQEEQTELLERLRELELRPVVLHGKSSLRLVRHFGLRYDYASATVSPGERLPAWLEAIRERCAGLAGVHGAELRQTLVTFYPPGAGIGWHRDARAFGAVVGLSLGSPCELRFRKGSSGRTTFAIELEPGSAYLLTGEARSEWQHSIPPVALERWSVTFRTLRGRRVGAPRCRRRPEAVCPVGPTGRRRGTLAGGEEGEEMRGRSGSEVVADWPEESREAAQRVIAKYGEPAETSESFLVWFEVGPWKRVVATRAYWEHAFPAPHVDCVESVVDYYVPTDQLTPLAEFDGSVVVERTAGELSARCHDEEANNLALNLVHDIITGEKTVEEARAYYAQEFLDHRRGRPTPYMDELLFDVGGEPTVDPDTRVLSDDDLARAESEGREAA